MISDVKKKTGDCLHSAQRSSVAKRKCLLVGGSLKFKAKKPCLDGDGQNQAENQVWFNFNTNITKFMIIEIKLD